MAFVLISVRKTKGFWPIIRHHLANPFCVQKLENCPKFSHIHVGLCRIANEKG